jgi:hypothetical protein
MKHLKLFVAAALMILAAAGCKKTTYEPPPAIAAVSFYNASPDSPPVSIYLNSNKIQFDSLAYKGGIDYVSAYPGAREVSAYKNGLARPAAGKANIRFVNMRIGSPTLDLGVNDGTTLISNRAYKANSAFSAIDGNKQYTFVVREHGATVAKVALPSVNIINGHSYTIWARGVYTATDATVLGADIVLNY